MHKTLIQEIHTALSARRNCLATGNHEWVEKWEDRLKALEDLLPSGSGFDSGTKIDTEDSTEDRVVLTTSYHHMSEHGYYTHWSDWVIEMRPTFDGIHCKCLEINVDDGHESEGIEDYIADTFYELLSRRVDRSKTDFMHVAFVQD